MTTKRTGRAGMTMKERGLADIRAHREEIKRRRELINEIVAVLRTYDLNGHCEASWREIGEALGLTTTGAQMAYRHLSWIPEDQ